MVYCCRFSVSLDPYFFIYSFLPGRLYTGQTVWSLPAPSSGNGPEGEGEKVRKEIPVSFLACSFSFSVLLFCLRETKGSGDVASKKILCAS